jgi:glycosyltransferase involved in cell wall biosynthesis
MYARLEGEGRRVRIAIDCRAIGPGATGIGAFAASALEALGRDLPGGGLVVLARPDAGLGAHLPDSVLVVEVGPTRPLWYELELPALLEEEKVDVFFSPIFVCPVVCGARYVVAIHDVFPESHPELCTGEFSAFWKRRLGPAMRAACHVVTVSEWSKGQAVNRLRLPPERVSVVRQSVSAEFRPLEPGEIVPVLSKYGLRAGGYVLYVGALDPRKNLERLIGAFARLSGDRLRLVLAGKAVTEGYDLAGAAEKRRVRDQVSILGHVEQGDLPALYCGARCLAFPSLAEGFGRPPMEAMACGVPVVASDRTALPETCGDAALLPDPEDETAMAGCIEKACFDEPAREQLIRTGLARSSEYTGRRFASDLASAFEAALAGPAEGLWSG